MLSATEIRITKVLWRQSPLPPPPTEGEGQGEGESPPNRPIPRERTAPHPAPLPQGEREQDLTESDITITRLSRRLVLILWVFSVGATAARADVLTTADGQKMVVTVLRLTDEGVVVKTSAGEKTYAFDELEAKCAYGYMRRQVKDDDAEGHIRLGKYCLRRKLFEEATAELLLAKKLDPKLDNEINKIWAEANAERPRPRLTAEQIERIVTEQRSRAERVRAATGEMVHTLETDHFIIHTTFDKAEHRPHMNICEDLYQGFDRIFQISRNEDRMWDGKCVMYLFKDRVGFVKFAQVVHHYPGHQAGGYFRAQRGQCEVVVPLLKKGDAGVATFKETMVHEGAHAFLHFYRDPGHVPTWVHEGVAQYLQFEKFPESATLRRHNRTVRKGVKTGTVVPLVVLAASRRPSAGGDHAGYAYSYSYVSYMIQTSGSKFAAFIRGLKSGLDAEEALKKAYDWDFETMQKGWQQAVARGLQPSPLIPSPLEGEGWQPVEKV